MSAGVSLSNDAGDPVGLYLISPSGDEKVALPYKYTVKQHQPDQEGPWDGGPCCCVWWLLDVAG